MTLEQKWTLTCDRCGTQGTFSFTVNPTADTDTEIQAMEAKLTEVKDAARTWVRDHVRACLGKAPKHA